jgi:hypothetical protein
VKLSICGVGDAAAGAELMGAELMFAPAVVEFELLPFDCSAELQADNMEAAKISPATAKHLKTRPAFVINFLLGAKFNFLPRDSGSREPVSVLMKRASSN